MPSRLPVWNWKANNNSITGWHVSATMAQPFLNLDNDDGALSVDSG